MLPAMPDRTLTRGALRRWTRPVAAAACAALLLAACGRDAVRPTPPVAVDPTPAPLPAPPPVRVGLALGGGAAKGFAHIGVIKMLEANDIRIDVVAGTCWASSTSRSRSWASAWARRSAIGPRW